MFKKARVIFVLEKKTRVSHLLSLLPSNLKNNLFGKTTSLNKNDSLEYFLSSLPINTVFSKSINSTNNSYHISLPFFSSHIKVPVKSGEFVWIYEQDKNSVYDIDSYWLSRVHGLNFSEDVNYTYNDRDIMFDNTIRKIQPVGSKARSKKIRKEFIDENLNSIVFETNPFDDKDNNLLSSEISFISSSLNKYPLRCIPLTQGHSDDLVFQGSNNTQIKLTTDRYYNNNLSNNTTGKGEVIISAGSGQFVFNENRSDITFGNIFDKKGDIQDILHVMTNTDSDSYPLKVSIDGKEENFKNPEMFYLNEHSNVFKGNEGAFRALSDASRISVSEGFNSDKDFLRTFNVTYNSDTADEKYLVSHISSNLVDLSKSQSSKDEERKDHKHNNFFSNNNSYINKTSEKTSTISLSSSNINLFSRTSDGGIKLIKEYYSNTFSRNMSALIRIDNKGDAFIDANRIFIGNYKYFEDKKLLDESESEEKSNISLIHLGESEYSEPLVLGNHLKEYILEIVDINRQDMHDTKNLFIKTKSTMEELNNNYLTTLEEKIENSFVDVQVSLGFVLSKAAAVPTFGSALVPAFEETINAIQKVNDNLKDAVLKIDKLNKEVLDNFNTEIVKIKSKREEFNSKRLEAIENNIDKILSKISKTS